MMGARKLVIEIDAETEAALARSADERHVPIEQVAAEAVVLHTLRGGDQPDEAYQWTEEDLAAIREGFDQLDRGEGVDQAVLEREIADFLRS